MKNIINKDKIITIGILPIMWLIYFLFEVFSGRVNDLYTLILNISLIFLFAFVGWIIYMYSIKNIYGVNTKILIIIFFILMLLDQGLKLIIKINFFHSYLEIIPEFLYFNPIINTQGSWLNARFNFNIGFSLLIIINGIALILFLELYRYLKYKNIKIFWTYLFFIFIFSLKIILYTFSILLYKSLSSPKKILTSPIYPIIFTILLISKLERCICSLFSEING